MSYQCEGRGCLGCSDCRSLSKAQLRRMLVDARRIEPPEDDDTTVRLSFSTTTMKLLAQLAEMGVHGIGIGGVCEGFVYRGLQETTRKEGGA